MRLHPRRENAGRHSEALAAWACSAQVISSISHHSNTAHPYTFTKSSSTTSFQPIQVPRSSDEPQHSDTSCTSGWHATCAEQRMLDTLSPSTSLVIVHTLSLHPFPGPQPFHPLLLNLADEQLFPFLSFPSSHMAVSPHVRSLPPQNREPAILIKGVPRDQGLPRTHGRGDTQKSTVSNLLRL